MFEVDAQSSVGERVFVCVCVYVEMCLLSCGAEQVKCATARLESYPLLPNFVVGREESRMYASVFRRLGYT